MNIRTKSTIDDESFVQISEDLAYRLSNNHQDD
jgi:hypothetical protein